MRLPNDILCFVLGAMTASTLFILVGFNWPSASGTTAPGVVIEDGAGNALGTNANPLVCQ